MLQTLKTAIRVIVLSSVFLMFGSEAFSQNCDAGFFGKGTGNFGVTFYNISSGNYTTSSWDFGGGMTSNQPTAVQHIFANSGTFQVCLTVTDNGSGCQATQCQPVTIDALGFYQDSTCYNTDCVFPGDANADEIVNVHDVLPVAYNLGRVGKSRPLASLSFVGQAAADWQGSLFNGVNLKHVDCDGNGLVNFSDLTAIQQHFSFEHDGITQKSADGLPLWIHFDPIIYPTNPNDPFEITAGIMLGTATDPANDVLGISFALKYDPTLVDAGSVGVTFNNTSFIGQNNLPIQFVVDNPTLGILAMAYARTDLQQASGYGRVATVKFTITDIVIGQKQQIKFDLEPIGPRAVDSLGQSVDVSPIENSLIFSTTGTEEASRTQPIQLFPNPADDQLFVDFGMHKGEMVEIFDVYGQPVKRSHFNQTGQVEVPISHLPTGLYTVRVRTKEGAASQQIFIK